MNNTNPSPTALTIRPVGYVKSELKEGPVRPKTAEEAEARKSDTSSYHDRVKTLVSDLVINSDVAECLDGIEACSHIMVIFWPHLLPEENRNLRKVHPTGRRDIPLQGIFATRSPARPNPVLVSEVKLVERDKNILRVMGLEALDGSPIVDIKPVTRLSRDPETKVKVPEWMDRFRRDAVSDKKGESTD